MGFETQPPLRRKRTQLSIKRLVKRVTPLWVAGVIVGSFLPGPVKRSLGTRPFVLHHPVAVEHRIAHMVIFGATGLLFLLLADRPKDQVRAVGSALSLGFGIELTQFAVGFSRVFEWWDLRDDAIGILGVVFIFRALQWAGFY